MCLSENIHNVVLFKATEVHIRVIQMRVKYILNISFILEFSVKIDSNLRNELPNIAAFSYFFITKLIMMASRIQSLSIKIISHNKCKNYDKKTFIAYKLCASFAVFMFFWFCHNRLRNALCHVTIVLFIQSFFSLAVSTRTTYISMVALAGADTVRECSDLGRPKWVQKCLGMFGIWDVTSLVVIIYRNFSCWYQYIYILVLLVCSCYT